ncbi:hypothetical protein [Pseudarthrobacter sp. lyk4-40-TYG-27]|uniref:hypothetical protein n=1 Tax=Pseudarthrobacter sp. lyk4-40-TYG-27 TaxID=3040305 RepID=UPI002553E695|nr:hypothetical protein [Pseudarthrobacter sp. lyk4-40-TYG-27]
MEDEALADIADRLYAGDLDGFIAARAAAAKEAAGQDKELAAAVRALAKPSVAAWAVNMLARQRPNVLADLAALGERMRSAQESLDAAALRALARERRTLLAAAVDTARTVAAEQGRPISSPMAADVEETLRALTADEGAAAAVASGRLLKVLTADGVNQVDLAGAVALPGTLLAVPSSPRPSPSPAAPDTTAAKTRTTPQRTSQPKPAKPRLEAVRQTPRPASPPALERAKAAHAQARAAEEEAARRSADLQAEAEEARTEIAELRQETALLRERLKAAEERLEMVRRKLSGMDAEAKQAARAADKARRAAMLAHERVLRLGSN